MRKVRNENGYGTVVCLDKTGLKRKKPWAVRVTIGWEEGKQKTKYIGYYEKEKDAQRALLEFNSKNINYDASTVTFEQVFEMWMDRNRDKLTPSNFDSYRFAYKLVPQLHHKKMKDIKYRQLQEAMDSVDRKFSSKSKIKSLMKQMYAIAMMNDLVMKDYSQLVDVKCRQEVGGSVFTSDEITHLWTLEGKKEVVDDVLILIYTGMRISEALSIKPSEDFHLEEGYIECHGTKNKASDRLIPIHPSIMPILEKRQQRKTMFVDSRENRTNYKSFEYRFKGLMSELSFEHNIHDTRKTFATVLHENDIVESDIKAMLGHTQIGVTHQVYIKHRIERLVEKIKSVTFM